MVIGKSHSRVGRGCLRYWRRSTSFPGLELLGHSSLRIEVSLSRTTLWPQEIIKHHRSSTLHHSLVSLYNHSSVTVFLYSPGFDAAMEVSFGPGARLLD